MDLDTVPGPLRARLGDAAAAGLLDLFDRARGEGRAEVMDAISDRFERRLAEEMGAVRVQIARSEASLRTELAQFGAALRQEMTGIEGRLREEMASGRFELLKWCFLFWIGQVVVMSTIIGVMLRITR